MLKVPYHIQPVEMVCPMLEVPYHIQPVETVASMVWSPAITGSLSRQNDSDKVRFPVTSRFSVVNVLDAHPFFLVLYDISCAYGRYIKVQPTRNVLEVNKKTRAK